MVNLGICSYSFTKETTLADAIASTRKLGLHAINIKPEFHLPYASTPAQIREARKMLDDAGVRLVGTGATYLTKMDDAEIRQRFEFNKALGSPLIVIGPTAETLPLIERYVKEYGIKVAIHNHGPTDKHFPTPQSALKVIANMDPRVGLCIDVGHTIRAGVDPVAAIKQAGARLLDVHGKDVVNAGGKWDPVAVGDGDLPIPKLFRTLSEMKFQGYWNLEHETKDDAQMTAMQRSFCYMRGVLAGLG